MSAPGYDDVQEAMGLEPFAPPAERVGKGDGLNGAVVAGTWAMAGASIGTAFAAALQAIGLVGSLVPFGLVSAGIAGTLGVFAYRLERRHASSKRQLVDGRGRLVRPMSAWLLGFPVLLLAVGIGLLVMVAALRTGSWVPLAMLVVAFGAMVAFFRPLLAHRSLTRAVDALEDGDEKTGRARLEGINGAFWSPRGVREMAALNLGLMALGDGELDEASAWYENAGALRGRALAATGLALVRTLQERYDEADSLLATAGTYAEGRSAQVEIDGVRLLLTLRREGATEARAYGERLLTAGAGGLFMAVLAAARRQAGDAHGAAALLGDPSVDDTLRSSIGHVIPELRELRFGSFDLL